MLQNVTKFQTHVAANNLIGSREVTRIKGTCRCGTEVRIEYDETECENCGQLYNLFGQELRPRSQWEENDYDDY